MLLQSVRPLVFWPTFILLLCAVMQSFIDLDSFLALTKGLNSWILDRFAWLFSLGSLYLLLLAGLVYFSALGNIRIGGENAVPLLNKPRWFSITLCTTLAVGVLFWTTAEPIYHLNGPPASSGLEGGSPDAALFSMATMLLHWSFTPYAIYTIPALTFALAFYNCNMPFSISSTLQPVLGDWVLGKRGQVIDALALYALVAGMASSLGTGALTLAGGVGEFVDISSSSPVVLGIIIAVIVATFIASAASGLRKGIARLSAINAALLLVLGLFVFVFGPTAFIMSLGTESLGVYLDNFFQMSLFTGAAAADKWPQWWSTFYWAVWFAWAPISALFLGRIARGYTVREFIQMNLLLPGLFAVIWIFVFSGTAIHLDMTGEGVMNSTLKELGLEKLLYYVFDQLPFSTLMTLILIFVAFISYVTAADSNTDAIGNLCTKGLTADTDESASLGMKVLWGSVIGIVSWVMVSFVGIDGVKMLSNLGGLPALVIVLLTSFTLAKWLRNPSILQGGAKEL